MNEYEDHENELSPERRARVIARAKLGYQYRLAARLRDQAEELETSATM